MSQRSGGRAAANSPDRPTTNASQRTAQSTGRLPYVLAFRYPPSGRRTLALDIVIDCPHCLPGCHSHRQGKGLVRRAGCGRGRYVLVPRVVRSRRSRLVAA